ncbi:hypothetical protein K461DRAFT_175998 [Myriangium duriaei CBS 260.36]|uniref:Uncharacterized protein n=1 Tax=Myriangium duriaei CBS 260.36 TaxID=1168546 RepID=A0A9P4MDU7_9PEZI|nr:hypothetical protein K461DRAFT_175998 [Myriangium duriaei CBS 260.36]
MRFWWSAGLAFLTLMLFHLCFTAHSEGNLNFNGAHGTTGLTAYFGFSGDVSRVYKNCYGRWQRGGVEQGQCYILAAQTLARHATAFVVGSYLNNAKELAAKLLGRRTPCRDRGRVKVTKSVRKVVKRVEKPEKKDAELRKRCVSAEEIYSINHVSRDSWRLLVDRSSLTLPQQSCPIPKSPSEEGWISFHGYNGIRVLCRSGYEREWLDHAARLVGQYAGIYVQAGSVHDQLTFWNILGLKLIARCDSPALMSRPDTCPEYMDDGDRCLVSDRWIAVQRV